MAEEKNIYSDVASFFADQEHETDLLSLEGFLEKDAESSGNVKFAPGGDCAGWIVLPATALKRIEIIRRNQWCYTEKDGYHRHPYVQISIDLAQTAAAKGISGLIDRVMTRNRNIRLPVAAATRRSPSRTVRHGPIAMNPQRFRLENVVSRRPLYECDDDYPICVGQVSNCPPYYCACCNDDNERFCSTCCAA